MMKCPRCQTVITATPDPSGSLTCPGCGARLRSRSAAASRPAPLAAAPTSEVEDVLGRLDPSGPSRLPDGRNPNATLPPGTPLPRIPRPSDPRATPLKDMPGAREVLRTSTPAAAPSAAPAADLSGGSTARLLEALLAELKGLRSGQERILKLLDRSSEHSMSFAPSSFGLHVDEPVPAGSVPEVRARRRKTVLLVDDDAATLAAALAALESAEVPVRTAKDGSAALVAITEEKPDVLVMELDVRGAMAGKDVINLIKATMEWVDMPIVLYTRVPIDSQKEARTVHGADEFVLKAEGPEALVARVITVFRKP